MLENEHNSLNLIVTDVIRIMVYGYKRVRIHLLEGSIGYNRISEGDQILMNWDVHL